MLYELDMHMIEFILSTSCIPPPLVVYILCHALSITSSVDVRGSSSSDMKKAAEQLKDPRFKKAAVDGAVKKNQDPRFIKPAQQSLKMKKEKSSNNSAPKKRNTNSSMSANDKDGGYLIHVLLSRHWIKCVCARLVLCIVHLLGTLASCTLYTCTHCT